MNPESGEIKKFFDQTEIPKSWDPLPWVGEVIEVLVTTKKFGATLTKKHRAKIIEIEEGDPGRLVLEMLPDKS